MEPQRGEVHWVDPDPTRGREQAKPRPFVVVSVDELNGNGLGLSLAVPLTRTDFANALHLPISAGEAGLPARSFAMPEQLRAVAHERFSCRLGRLGEKRLDDLLKRCRVLLR